jgi:hypothetical protein
MNELLKKTYIQEVIKYLPETQRQDIREELETNIEAQMENENLSLEDVLLNLGHPKTLAYSYLDKDENVIGPSYKESYYNTLKLLIPLIWVIIVVVNLISLIFTGEFDIVELLSSVWQSTFVVFTYVTVSFIIAEKVTKGKNIHENWHPNDLKINKYSHKTWSRSNSYVGIIFILVLLVIFNRFPELIGINVIGENINVPLLNLNYFDTYLLWVNIALVISATRLFLRLFFVNYTKLTSIVSVSLNLISLVIALIFLLSPQLLNPNLASELANLGFPEVLSFNVINYSFKSTGIIILILFCFESYKELKYGFN